MYNNDNYHVVPKMTGSHKSRIKYLLRKSPPRSQSCLTENRKLSNVKGKTGKGRRHLSESRDGSKILVIFPQDRVEVIVIRI